MNSVLTFSTSEIDDFLRDPDYEIDNQIKELKHDFHEALTDKPEVLKYIERLHTVIRRQQKKLNKFYRKLKDHKFVKKNETENKFTQTNENCKGQLQVLQDDKWHFTGQDTETNIADEVKEVAESAMKHTSFVYEPTSGMYYDYNTGYYYNAELRMYYDGNTGRYLEYDAATKSYKYHLAVGNESSKSSNNSKPKADHKHLKKIQDKQKGRKAKKSKLDDTEEGEIIESSISESSSSTSEEENDTIIDAYESGFGCEPCMRIMVEETNVEKLRVGSLFVVTCKGGTLGREGDHAVLIPDISVSKHHAKFVFNSETSLYYITDLGSRNGTWLDGERLSAALQESEMFQISHGAVIQIASTKLLCHIHVGRDTCSSCEPGLVQQTSNASVWDTGSRNSEYKEQLQNLKKRFGVDGVSQDVYNIPGYEDRAEMRRTAVGSSHSSEKTQAASVSELIPKCNKGFKMLSKMGWTEGQTLGKKEGGLAEPVSLQCNAGKCGLGMVSVERPAPSRSVRKKQDILMKTQNRYKNIEGHASGDSE